MYLCQIFRKFASRILKSLLHAVPVNNRENPMVIVIAMGASDLVPFNTPFSRSLIIPEPTMEFATAVQKLASYKPRKSAQSRATLAKGILQLRDNAFSRQGEESRSVVLTCIPCQFHD